MSFRRQVRKRGRLEQQRLPANWILTYLRLAHAPAPAGVTPVMRMGRVPWCGQRREKWMLRAY